VVQLGKKMGIAVSGDFEVLSGTGSQANKKVGKGTNAVEVTTFSANLKGIGTSRGSSLKLTGTNNVLITGYQVVSNAPPTIRSLTNLAAIPPLILTFTNLTTNTVVISTNIVFTVTNAVAANSYIQNTVSYSEIDIPPTIQTDLVPLGIKTIIKTGKIMGQTLPVDSKTSKATRGLNEDAFYEFDDGVFPQ
jgi:hypothetical protein